MVNYILLYKIRRIVKKILKDKIADDEIATTPKSCIGCLADDISWEIYYPEVLHRLPGRRHQLGDLLPAEGKRGQGRASPARRELTRPASPALAARPSRRRRLAGRPPSGRPASRP